MAELYKDSERPRPTASVKLSTTSWSRISSRNAILLARLASFCVDHADLGRYSAAIALNNLESQDRRFDSVASTHLDLRVNQVYEEIPIHKILKIRCPIKLINQGS